MSKITDLIVAVALVSGPATLSLANTLTQVGADIDGEAAAHASGFAVSLSNDGSRIAIGSPEATEEIGQTRVYEYSGGAWTQLGADIDGENQRDYSGRSTPPPSRRLAHGARTGLSRTLLSSIKFC